MSLPVAALAVEMPQAGADRTGTSRRARSGNRRSLLPRGLSRGYDVAAPTNGLHGGDVAMFGLRMPELIILLVVLAVPVVVVVLVVMLVVALVRRGQRPPQVPTVPVAIPVVSQHASAPGIPPSIADELQKLAALRDRGLLSEEEFAAQKRRLLG